MDEKIAELIDELIESTGGTGNWGYRTQEDEIRIMSARAALEAAIDAMEKQIESHKVYRASVVEEYRAYERLIRGLQEDNPDSGAEEEIEKV